MLHLNHRFTVLTTHSIDRLAICFCMKIWFILHFSTLKGGGIGDANNVTVLLQLVPFRSWFFPPWTLVCLSEAVTEPLTYILL